MIHTASSSPPAASAEPATQRASTGAGVSCHARSVSRVWRTPCVNAYAEASISCCIGRRERKLKRRPRRAI
jgi:hypothetical protein